MRSVRVLWLGALCVLGTGCATARGLSSASLPEVSMPTASLPQSPDTLRAVPSASRPPTPAPDPPPPSRPRSDVQVGRASWYGRAHQGKATASGEPYDRNAMTAAHRSLPLGTRIRVTNVDNGRSVVLRVNDRGPFIDGRILDVSQAAARALGAASAGLFTARIEVLDDAAASTPPP
jgi:rare lipoprotein A